MAENKSNRERRKKTNFEILFALQRFDTIPRSITIRNHTSYFCGWRDFLRPYVKFHYMEQGRTFLKSPKEGWPALDLAQKPFGSNIPPWTLREMVVFSEETGKKLATFLTKSLFPWNFFQLRFIHSGNKGKAIFFFCPPFGNVLMKKEWQIGKRATFLISDRLSYPVARKILWSGSGCSSWPAASAAISASRRGKTRWRGYPLPRRSGSWPFWSV